MVLDLRFAPLAVVAAALVFSFLVVGGRPAVVALAVAARSWPSRAAAAVKVRVYRGRHHARRGASTFTTRGRVVTGWQQVTPR